MNEQRKENNLPRCPDCQLRTLERSGDDAHCTNCNKDFPGAFSKYDKPLLKTKTKRGQNYLHLPANKKHEFIEKNSESIIADLLSLGRSTVCHKWRISQSGLVNFERRHLTAEQKHQVTKVGIEAGSRKPKIKRQNGHIPIFPQFSDSWSEAVQLRWLEIYEKLAVKD